jgi:hypothetical protein
MSRIYIGGAVSIAAILGIVLVAIFSPDTLGTVSIVLGPVAAGGAWYGASGRRGGGGPPAGPTAVVSLLLMLTMGACGSTYTLRSGGYRLEPSAAGGHCLTVYGDGDPEVLRACIRQDSLSIAPALAARICQQYGDTSEED